MALFIVASILVWLTQMLRLFDLITAKGQGLWTLAGQAALTTPPLAREILYICMAVGLARAFKALQHSRELHTIHITQRVTAIWTALTIYILAGILAVMVLAHWGEPAARKESGDWTAQIAAELVGQNLVPKRFTEVANGVVVRIGGRQADGTIVDFFADDSRRPNIRRTYFAETATIISSELGYQISLRNGRLQILPDDDKYSEIEFARYELAIDTLTEERQGGDSWLERPSWQLFDELQTNLDYPPIVTNLLNKRFAEAPRVLGICLLVAALLAFPHARRGRDWLPIEVLVLVVAFAERSASNSLMGLSDMGAYFGPGLLLIVALALMAWRFYSFLHQPRERQSQAAVAA